VFLGACRRRRRRGGFQLYQLWAAWGATVQLSGIRLGLWVSRFRFLRKIQLQRAPHPVFRLVITLEVVAAAAGPLGWEGEAGDHG
jgi:hypothetical protein